MTYGHHHFEAGQRAEAPESWHHLNQAIWPEICTTHLKACKQVLAKNNSGSKLSNHAIFTSWLTFSHISLSQKNHYKMRMITIVLKKAKSSKKAWEELGTLAGVYVNSVYSCPRWRQNMTFLLPTFKTDFRCSHNGGPPVIWIISWYMWYQI